MDAETEGNSADLSNTPESRKNSWQIFFEEIIFFLLLTKHCYSDKSPRKKSADFLTVEIHVLFFLFQKFKLLQKEKRTLDLQWLRPIIECCFFFSNAKFFFWYHC